MYGRKHSYRLYCKLLNEAARWSNAVQNVIDSKAPIETPTQQLIQDIKVGHDGKMLLIKQRITLLLSLVIIIINVLYYNCYCLKLEQ